jgi:hypothetical protein
MDTKDIPKGYTLHMQDAPRWYDLGVDGFDLLIHLHPKTVVTAFERLNHPGMLAHAKEQQGCFVAGRHPIRDFDPPSTTRWGFGGVLKTSVPRADGWVTVRAKSPRAINEDTIPWIELFELASTLSLLLDVLNHECGAQGDNRLQCMTVQTSTQLRDCYGATIAAKLSPAFVGWLGRAGDEALVATGTTMRRVYKHMSGYRYPNLEHEFYAQVRAGRWLHLSTLGNACGLDPSHGSDETDKGYELSPHNTDSPLHQLPLLYGMAELCDQARTAGI